MKEMQEMHMQSLGLEDPWEESLATHSSIITWRISRTEEPGGLQSMGSPRDTTEQLRTRTCVHARMHTHTWKLAPVYKDPGKQTV